ncbi:hypothetical protein BQ6471_01476 [Vibrio gazogenes]|nr:hypothetical protein BQ6471_01476 [Vibrio gazogenes]
MWINHNVSQWQYGDLYTLGTFQVHILLSSASVYMAVYGV